MVGNTTISRSIFEVLGVIQSISNMKLGDMLLEGYHQFLIGKLKGSLIVLKGCIYELKEYTPEAAEKEVEFLSSLVKVLSPFKKALLNISEGEDDIEEVRKLSLEVISTLEYLYVNLKDISLAHYSYLESIPVLSKDWDKEEDNHWDDY